MSRNGACELYNVFPWWPRVWFRCCAQLNCVIACNWYLDVFNHFYLLFLETKITRRWYSDCMVWYPGLVCAIYCVFCGTLLYSRLLPVTQIYSHPVIHNILFVVQWSYCFLVPQNDVICWESSAYREFWHNVLIWQGLPINTLRPRQNGRHFADDTFKRIFMNESVRISINISLKFVPKCLINNTPAWVQIMAWRRPSASHYLSQWWLIYWRIYASLGVNELRKMTRWILLFHVEYNSSFLLLLSQANSLSFLSLSKLEFPNVAGFVSRHWGGPDSKVHVANTGPTWGRQDPGGPHVGYMNFAIWGVTDKALTAYRAKGRKWNTIIEAFL